ncbi:Pimeloyl-ACP methyl ester carboxylesterase [Paenibacillus catalpae]|uniref:Pimeloyl-ACP methyl ester carboxylesterase n=1 Tax=Paenibacillus catalpae TaxID=1045775 RepID=A0A1I2DMB2_9BACL|nr:alpha/beta hydrolase [Paenibacillus catalpae]SFE81745.1 Pimeloyl-ACP methyl ester carboxylesterase [Paenibacillus catalpae]
MWRRVWKIALYFLVLLLTLIGVGSLYQWYGSAQDARSYKPVGKLYDVAGNKMHLYVGGQGDTTVVFASGWGTPNPYADFSPLYKGLEPHVKVAVYDRFGYGFSDTTDRKRDIDTITNEIHELLRAANLKPPYIFVGHSLGSLETIRYAQQYPGEVKGILLIEGGSPEYYARQDGYTVISYGYRALRNIGALRALFQVNGFSEWANDQSNGLRLLPGDLKALSNKAMLLKAGNRNMTDEIRQSRANAKIILADKKPLDIPLTVLTADYFGKLGKDKAWENSQAALPSWSRSGKQIIVPSSSHYIHSYQPGAVVRELLKLSELKVPVN